MLDKTPNFFTGVKQEYLRNNAQHILFIHSMNAERATGQIP